MLLFCLREAYIGTTASLVLLVEKFEFFFSVNNKHRIILSRSLNTIRPYSNFLSLRHFTVINKSFYFQKLSSTSQNNQHYRCG